MMAPVELARWKELAEKRRDGSRHTLLMVACQETDFDAVEALIADGEDVHAVSEWSGTPLTLVINDCRCPEAKRDPGLRIVATLLSRGVDPNVVGRGSTPIQLAVVYRLVDIAKLLIAHGADVNLANKDGDTPLKLAIKLRLGKRIIKLLEDAGGRA